MRIVIFGANGRTGRQVIIQALGQGHEVIAVTRHPTQIPGREGLSVLQADVSDREAVERATAGGDAVISTLGVPYSRRPVTVYSTGTANIISAMATHDLQRFVVVGTAGIDPDYRASDSAIFTRVMEPLFMRIPGKTLYEDNRRMEARVRSSDLDWTIVRACWLFNPLGPTEYQIVEGPLHGMFTARTDLAACLLAQLSEDRYVRKTIGVLTTAGTPRLARQIWREGIKKGMQQ